MSQRSKNTDTLIKRVVNRVSCNARLLLSGAAALAVLGFSPAYAAPSFPTGSCAASRSGGDIQCTANDVTLTEVQILNVQNCILGDEVTVNFNANITGGQPKRYDIGVFISDDGLDPTILPANGGAATCQVFSVSNTAENLADGFNNFDDDQCLEAPSGASAVADDFTSIQVPCIPDANGFLTLNTVVTWDNKAGNVCTGPDDVFANTGSKCNKTVIITDIPVVALGQVIIRKETNPDGDITDFNFVSTGIPDAANDPVCGADPMGPNPPPANLCPTEPEDFVLSDGESNTVNVGTVSQNGTTFTFTEDFVAGWGVSSIACTDFLGAALPAGTVTTNLANRTVSITLDFDTTQADCTFTNAQGGSLTVQKTVVDANPAGGEVAGADYSVRVDCGGNVQTFTLENGATDGGLFSGIANGTLCVVSEQGPFPAANPGYSYVNPPTIEIQPSGAACAVTPAGALACQQFTMTSGGIFSATITNTLQANPAAITVTKDVTGDPLGLAPGSTFPITIDCNVDPNFQGGSNSGSPGDGGTVTLNTALAGSTCQAYEVSQPAANPGYAYETPVVQVTSGGANVGACNPIPDPSVGCVQFSVGPGDSVAVTVTNNLIVLPGDVISVTKDVTNVPAGYDPATLFDVSVNCGGAFDLQLNDDETLPGPEAVPGGTLCVVSEGPLPAAPTGFEFGTPTITIGNAVQAACANPPVGSVACQQFLMPPGAGNDPPPGVTVTVNNPLVATDGGVSITKTVTGGGYVALSEFSLTIDCGAGGTITDGVANGGSIALNDVTAGSICQVYESSPLPAPAANFSYGTPSVTISGAVACNPAPAGPPLACQQFTMPPGGSITGTVTNPTTPNPGDVVTISKTVTGQTAGYVAASTFDINVNCNGSQVTATLANGASQAGPQDVPAGTQCAVNETSVPAAAAGYTYGTPTITITGGETTPVVCNSAGPCNFTMPAGGSVTVAVANPVSAGPGTVTSFSKTVVGARAGLLPGTLFHFTLTCGAIVFEFDLGDLGNGGGPGDIPAGTVCTIVEDSPPNPLLGYFFSGSSFTVTGAVGTPCTVPEGFACRQFTVGAGANITIAGVNTLAAADVIQAIPTLGRYELLALMLLMLGFGLVAVPRYLRNRG